MNNNYSILYVDDELVNRRLFEMTVNKYCHVITADSGLSGLKVLEDHPEILHVYTDFKMPGMNGYEFILAAREHNPKITFYIVSGYFITPELKKAQSDGIFKEYYIKPFDARNVLKDIDL